MNAAQPPAPSAPLPGKVESMSRILEEAITVVSPEHCKGCHLCVFRGSPSSYQLNCILGVSECGYICLKRRA